MKVFSPWSKGAVAFLVISFLPTALFAADLPPSNASAEVIEKKIREDARKDFLATKPPQKIEAEVKKPESAKGKARFFAREIEVRFNRTMKPETVKLVDPELFEPARKLYQGKEITFDDLNDMNRGIEEILRREGYFAVVFTPPQKIKDGKVYVEVLLSRMGAVKVEGNKYFRAAKTRSYWKIPPGEILRSDRMYLGIQAMNDNPDRVVKPILRAGKEPGTTDVILKSTERLPLHGGFSFDNQGSKVTGKQRYGFTARHNNLLTLDDQFAIGTVFGRYFGALFMNHVLPLTGFGTRLVTGFSHAQVTPQKEFADQGINGLTQTYSLALYQSILKKETLKLDSHLGFDFKEKSTRVQNETTTWDRLRVISLGTDFQSVDSRGVWAWAPAAYAGFSPHGNGYELTSRQAHTHFLKFDVSVQRQQRLPFGTKGVLRLEAQVSPYKLPPQEQMFMGGGGVGARLSGK